MANADSSLRKIIEAEPQGRKWLDLVTRSTVAASREEALQHLSACTADGIVIPPIYPLTDHSNMAPSICGRHGRPWKTFTRVDHPSPQQANRQLLSDLEQGADGAVLVLAGAASAHGFGIEIDDDAALEMVLQNVLADATSLRFEGMTLEQFHRWTGICKKRGYDPAKLDAAFSFQLALPGVKGAVAPQAGLIADATRWHNKGASAAVELGLALGQLVAMMRTASEVHPDTGLSATRWSAGLSCDADQFETVAKFRAMRLLWRKLTAVLNTGSIPLHLHATTSWRMMSRRDPWTNSLRNTVAAFSAGIGGADSVTVLPHTQPLGLPDRFARRVARNISLILQEESHLSKVSDPAAGAGIYDALSRSLAEQAWNHFQSIEAAGGFFAFTDSGGARAMIKSSRTVRLADMASRKIVSIGNSHFARLDEPVLDTLMSRPLEPADEDFGDLRDSLLFEHLCCRAQALSLNREAAVLLICLGEPKRHKPREGFASDFFTAGGLNTTSLALSVDGDINTYQADQTPIVCLCGSDDDYDSAAGTLVSGLRTEGAQHILLAGRHDLAGVDDRIFSGCNAVAVLDTTLSLLEERVR
uniref:methylmalonyl-CoA mutase family protein n=1 Tax=Pararhizobium sp. IMCC3301 TaxID=3067904 RepID=UPI002742910D|nr:methylmalonyl-CoA mutase family protein [Pararhizobium sp. IMCC3301]